MKSAIALIIAILMAVGTRAAEQAFQLSADRAIIYTQKLDLNSPFTAAMRVKSLQSKNAINGCCGGVCFCIILKTGAIDSQSF